MVIGGKQLSFERVSHRTLSTVLAILGLSRRPHCEKMALLRIWHSEVAQSKGKL